MADRMDTERLEKLVDTGKPFRRRASNWNRLESNHKEQNKNAEDDEKKSE
jgi:hypothetical protein